MSKYGLLAISILVLCCIFLCECDEVNKDDNKRESLDFWKGNSQLKNHGIETQRPLRHMKSTNKSKKQISVRKKRRKTKKRKSKNLRRDSGNNSAASTDDDIMKPMLRKRLRNQNPHFRNRHHRRPSLRNNETEISFDTLTPYNIAAQLKELEKLFPEENITQEVIGRTVEYNDIVLLKIKYALETNGTRYMRTRDENVFDEEARDRKIIFVVHGLSMMGFKEVPCFTEPHEFVRLVSTYLQYSHIFDIFIIPIANPDAVAATNIYWNKNMSPQKDCSGVALDRNFEIAWNTSKRGSCNQQYPGPSPFSEAESRAVRDVFHRYGHKIVGYFHVHAGMFSDKVFKGDAVLYPKGYTGVQSDDDRYVDLKGEIDEVMRNASFRYLSVAVQTLHSWYGPVTGTSVDYASTVYGIPYAMELSMQIYENTNGEFPETDSALDCMWIPVINVIFNKIYVDLGVKGEV